MNSRSLASEYIHPSIIEAGPWDALPPKYIPRVKDYYFPGQVNLGIDFNEQEIRTFAEKHHILCHRNFGTMAYQVANYCTEQCGLSNKRELRISRLARKGVYCLTFIDNYELSQCRPEDLQQAIWRLEDLWLEAGFESKQILWHTSGTQATRKGTIACIDPSAVM